MIKNILFDFDGTLVDTNDLIILALKETSRKFLNRELSDHDLNAILGKYLDHQMQYLSSEHWEQMVQFYKEFYNANKDIMIKDFPGISDMLCSVKNLGLRTAIVSAKGRNGIIHGLRHFQLEGYIDVIISAYDIENNKPHPEPALKALAALGAKASEALLVGDSPYDILCGKNAGVKTALVAWTIFPDKSFIDLKPDYYIETPQDLVQTVKNLY